MLNFFRFFGRTPHPTLDEPARAWIEEKLRWLQVEFGEARLIDARIIEPTPTFFPDPYNGSDDSAKQMFERVCEYMEVPSSTVELRLYDESNRPMLVNEGGHLLPGSAGTYQEGERFFVIRLERNSFERPMEVVGTMAHELSHLRLLGENRYDAEHFDNELLTDLTATFFGFGIFLANCPRHWHSQLSHWPGTDLRRPEYMSLPMYGFTLAMISEMRFEENPPAWLHHMNRDARSEYRAARRYLNDRA